MQEDIETKKTYMKAEDYIGKKFNKLTVLEIDHHDKNGAAFVKCRCDCGNVCIATISGLRKGNNKSCGCMHEQTLRDIVKHRKDQTTHGGAHSRLYRIWCSMRSRCRAYGTSHGKNYADRGITVCEEWSDFENFRKWAMASGYDETAPKGQCTLDRIDANGNYEPSNCRWITIKEQGRNRRNTFYVDYNGKKTPLKEVCEIEGVPYSTVWRRIRKCGMDLDSALHTEPIHGRRLCNAR